MADLFITHGAGLDIHKKVIVATVMTPTVPEKRTLGTLTEDLLTLADWLLTCRVTHVAMEVTGVLRIFHNSKPLLQAALTS